MATTEIMSLPRLPASTTYDLEKELALLKSLVAALSDAIAVIHTDSTAVTDATAAASKALVLVRRLRGFDGTDAERYATMQRVMEDTGLGRLLENQLVGELGAAVGSGASLPEARGGKALPLHLVVLLQQLWFLPMVLWPHGDPRPKIPHSYNTWALAAQVSTDEPARSRLLAEFLPELKAMVTDQQQAVELRVGAVSQLIFVCFNQSEMSFWRDFIRLDLIKAALQLLDQLMPGDEAIFAAASADVDCAFRLVLQACFGLLAGCTMHALRASDDATPAALAAHYIASGFFAVVLRTLRSFAALPSAVDANPIAGMVVAALQMIVLQKGCAQRLLTHHLSECGSTPCELYTLLECAIERGVAAPVCLQGVRLHLKAANVIALLFGRAEEDDDRVTITMSASVIKAVVETLQEMLEGISQGNVTHQAEAVFAISISDANTKKLVESGVLTLITSTLRRDQDELDRRSSSSSTAAATVNDNSGQHWRVYGTYNIKAAREAIIGILLNLALSIHTAKTVATHPGLEDALDHALRDTENLTPKAKKMIADIRFQLRMTDGSGVTDAIERVKEVELSTEARHFMLSYCWAQQELVKRIRAALGERDYKIWLDIEQIQVRQANTNSSMHLAGTINS